MAGVLERIRWPQKRAVIVHSPSAPKVDIRALELQAAKEVLAEVFGVRISDVDEMIQSRFDEAGFKETGSEDVEQWPSEFALE